MDTQTCAPGCVDCADDRRPVPPEATCRCGHRITQHTTCGCTQNCPCPDFMADDPGLNLDMLDADRLIKWAENIETYGDRLSEWADRAFVVRELRRIAAAINAEVRDVGKLRAEVQRLRNGPKP